MLKTHKNANDPFTKPEEKHLQIQEEEECAMNWSWLPVARIEQTESVMRKHGTNGVKLNRRIATNNGNDSRKKLRLKLIRI